MRMITSSLLCIHELFDWLMVLCISMCGESYICHSCVSQTHNCTNLLPRTKCMLNIWIQYSCMSWTHNNTKFLPRTVCTSISVHLYVMDKKYTKSQPRTVCTSTIVPLCAMVTQRHKISDLNRMHAEYGAVACRGHTAPQTFCHEPLFATDRMHVEYSVQI